MSNYIQTIQKIAPAISAAQADTTATILDEIQKAIEEKGATWTAGETSVSLRLEQ